MSEIIVYWVRLFRNAIKLINKQQYTQQPCAQRYAIIAYPKILVTYNGGDVIHPQLRKVGSGYETTAAMQEKNYCTGCGTEKIVKWLSSQREVAS